MKRVRTKRWNPVAHLRSTKARAGYLQAALEDGDPALVAAVLGDIARASGMTRVARQVGLGRDTLHKALSADGNPDLATVLRVLAAIGIELRAVPAPRAQIKRSSGNIFRDLGRPNADELLAKAELSLLLTRSIQRQGLMPREASESLGVSPSEFSNLMRGKLARFGHARLRGLLARVEGAPIDKRWRRGR